MSDVTINGPEDHLPAALLEGVPPEELYAAGGQYFKARAYPSARACLEKYLEQRPVDPAALHLLARVLYHQNTDFDKAEEYLNKAASLDPGSLTSYLETRGILLIHQAKFIRAREVFEYALAQDKQKNGRHTAALKFYLDLAKKKSGANRPHLTEPDEPKSLFFTAEHGRRRLKVRFFVLPSIIAHALILLLMMYLSTHQLPFKKRSRRLYIRGSRTARRGSATADWRGRTCRRSRSFGRGRACRRGDTSWGEPAGGRACRA